MASSGLWASRDGLSWDVLGPAPGFIYEDARGLFSANDDWQNGVPRVVGLQWSADGASWTSLSDQPAFTSGACHTGDDYIGGFYPIKDQLFAIGSAAWSSADGQTWQCIGLVEPPLRVSGGHDMLIGSGNTDPSLEQDYLWLSRDGVNWQSTTETADFMTPAPVADGFVALGQSYHNAPGVLLTSADGEAWTPQPVPFGNEILNENGRLESDGSRAAVVEDADVIPDSPGDVWVSSTNGSTWTRYPLPRRRSDYAQFAAILGDRLVVTGEDDSFGSQGHELIWTATIP